MEQIKLIIWDLDDTFWQGTLTESDVRVVPENVEIVRAMTKRGIVNSVASNNDPDRASEKLRELEVSDYFAGAEFGWSSKGEIVRTVVERLQFRNENVLFIDDSPRNLASAKYHNPGINVELPGIMDTMLIHPAFAGKHDPDHERLTSYRAIAQRNRQRERAPDNQLFLEEAEIQIAIVDDPCDEADRIHELVSRTNQLNFTKQRLTATEVSELLADRSRRSGTIRVRDRFGDYGVVGFYCLEPTGRHLEHYLFSCRILNLGVEQFVYHHLGCPDLTVQGEVVSDPAGNDKPHWITLVDRAELDAANTAAQESLPRVLVKGGCDVGLVAHYLRTFDYDVEDESGISEANGVATVQGHCQETVNLLVLSDEERSRLTVDLALVDMPGGDGTRSQRFDTRVWTEDYDVLVYNPMVDYMQDLYRHRATGFLIGYGGWVSVKPETVDYWLEQSGRRIPNRLMMDAFFARFFELFEHVGKIGPMDLVANLSFIRQNLSPRIPFVIMNGAEVEIEHHREADAHERHALLNEAISEFIEETDGCWLVDVRKFVQQSSDVTDNIRHYHARAYYSIAEEISSVIEEADLAVTRWSSVKRATSPSIHDRSTNS